jgi:uncharacterized protein DUF4382/carboxypeptidase family protein
MTKKRFSGRSAAAVAALAGLLVVAAAGCGGGGSTSGNGSLSVALSDAPPNLGNVTAVNVTVTKVEVHPGDGTETGDTSTDPTWKTCWQGTRTFNLLSLANVTDVTNLPLIVNQDSLTAGHYDQLRLIIDPSSATITVNGQTQPLTVPSGGQSGLKSKKFDITRSTNTVLLLDFNVDQSVTLQGNGTYQLKPVIDVEPLTGTGSVSGKVVDATGAAMGALVNVKDASGAIVGSAITTVGTTASPTDGVFAVHGLLPETYTLEVSATGKTTATMTTPLLVQGQTTDVGSVTLN